MSLAIIILGLIPATIIGWLALRLLEGRTPVLLQVERIALGGVLGLTGSMYIMFLCHEWLQLPISLVGFSVVFGLLLAILSIAWWMRCRHHPLQPLPLPQPSKPLSRLTLSLLLLLAVWTTVKIAAMSFILFTTPTYYDDALDNWNMRGKVFYVTQSIQLIIPPDTTAEGISSYPPTVPLVKAWLSDIRGTWDEGAINGVHIAWYIASLVLLYCFLRRRTSFLGAALGSYILASLPLYLVHGASPYADVFMSTHVFAAGMLLASSAASDDRLKTLSFLRLHAFAIALLPFTKNEGLVLYLPCVLLSFAWVLLHAYRRRVLTMKDIFAVCGFTAIAIAIVAGPWFLFKRMHGLTFGNAKGITGLYAGWQKNVLLSLTITNIFEANWIFLCVLFPLVLLLRLKRAFSASLGALTILVLSAYGIQLLLYLFTGLASEALMQTGSARGLIQLAPCIVALTVLLGMSFWHKDQRL